ncbi:hypothetical protein [Arthrobacter sp. OY3WO11]|nr:hypothetical protein [Arthrobacter sp. OY3WO11]
MVSTPILLNAGAQKLLFADAIGQPQIRVLRHGREADLVAAREEMEANGQ